MNYYVQSMMKLELTKEDMACLRKFANFLNEYAEEIDDDIHTIIDIITVMEDIEDNECNKELLRNKYRIEMELI